MKASSWAARGSSLDVEQNVKSPCPVVLTAKEIISVASEQGRPAVLDGPRELSQVGQATDSQTNQKLNRGPGSETAVEGFKELFTHSWLT